MQMNTGYRSENGYTPLENDKPTGELLEVRVGSRIDEVERTLIEATLEHFKGNKRRAAGVLGCSVKTLYNKLNEYSRNASRTTGAAPVITGSSLYERHVPNS